MKKPRTFADLIRAAAADDGRTAYALSCDTGLHHAIVTRFLKGERGLTLRTAQKLCEALDLELRQRGE